MATYAELQANIAGYLSRQDLTSDIQDAINRAIAHYERKNFWFQEQNGSFVTNVGQSEYSVSDYATNGYSSIEQVIVNYNNYRYAPEHINYLDLNSLDATQLYAQPSKWAENMEAIVFYPTPNATMTVSVSYVAKVDELTGDSDTNVFTMNAEELIEARACWWLCVNKTQNLARADVFKGMEMEALKILQEETTNKKAAGRITPTQF